MSRRSAFGSISTSPTSGCSGSTATVQAEVWMRPADSVSGTRCTRCAPDSNLSRANTSLPATREITSL